ncbi:MAG TPA: hypothetical protein VJ953_02165 [Saprospiraceae bacterium]|nr:hypothetical protein [Saprospiraceae bacterium]
MLQTAIHALRPFSTLILTEQYSDDQVLQFVKKNSGRVFLLPRAPFNTADKLEPLTKAGAHLLIRKSDISRQLITAEQRDTWVNAFKDQVFLQGYSSFSAKRFLQKGASILIDGEEPSGGMPALSVRDLCQQLQARSKLKVSYFNLSQALVLDMLRNRIKLVFSCPPDIPCERALLDKCLRLGVSNLVVAASSYGSDELSDCMSKNATVVITGQDKIPIDIIKSLAFNLAAEPIPARRLLKVFPDEGLQLHLIELRQLRDDQKIELLEDNDWYFNTAAGPIA